MSRAHFCYMLKRYEEALSNSNCAIELDDKNGHFYESRASAYTQLGRYEDAISDCNRAIELDDTVVLVLTNLVQVLTHNWVATKMRCQILAVR